MRLSLSLYVLKIILETSLGLNTRVWANSSFRIKSMKRPCFIPARLLCFAENLTLRGNLLVFDFSERLADHLAAFWNYQKKLIFTYSPCFSEQLNVTHSYFARGTADCGVNDVTPRSGTKSKCRQDLRINLAHLNKGGNTTLLIAGLAMHKSEVMLMATLSKGKKQSSSWKLAQSD